MNRKERKGAKPNSLEEVKSYIEKRGFGFSAVAFYTYYQSNDWQDRNGKPVKCWKQKCAIWNANEKKFKAFSFQKRGGRGKPLTDREKKELGVL